MKNELEKIDALLISWMNIKESGKKALKRFTGRVFNNDFQKPDEEEIKEKLGRKWRVVVDNLLELARFIDVFQPTTGKHAREFYLSCLDCKLVETFKGQKNLSNLIKKAVKIGMLQETKKGYSFNNEKATCKAYTYNPLIQFTLTNLSTNWERKGEGGHFKSGKNSEYYDIFSQMPFKNVDNGAIFADIGKISDNIKNYSFKSGDFGLLKATDAEIVSGLYSTYPLLRDYQEKVERINLNLPDFFKLRYSPKITRSKGGYITKIGIRAFSDFSFTPSGDFRNELLRGYGFSSVYSFDVKSSIYRVTYFLNRGEWLDNSIDFYDMMKPANSSMNREEYKQFAQRLYFSASPERVFYSLAPYGWKDKVSNEAEIKERIRTYWEKMREVIGKSFRSEIFYHESNIYIDLLDELILRGFKVVSNFDCFYSTCQEIQKIALELLPKIMKAYLNKTMNMEEEEQKESPENYTKGEAGILALEEDFYPRAEEEHRKAVAEYMKMVNEAKIKALRGLASRLLKKLK